MNNLCLASVSGLLVCTGVEPSGLLGSVYRIVGPMALFALVFNALPPAVAVGLIREFVWVEVLRTPLWSVVG